MPYSHANQKQHTMAKETITESTVVQVYKKETTAIEQFTNSIVIKTPEDLAKASDQVKAIKELYKKIEAEKKEFTAPAKAIVDKAKKMYDPALDTLEAMEKVLKGKALTYNQEENARIKAKEDKILKDQEEGKISDKTVVKKLANLPEEKKSVAGEGSQLRFTEYEDVEIVDQTLIPNNFMLPDMVKIKAAVLKARIEVPGVKIIKKTKTSSY